MTSTAVAALIGTGVGFLTLTITVIVLFTKIGRLIGGLEAVVKMLTDRSMSNSADINRLWEHQRVQDTAMGQCSVKLESTEGMVRQLHDHFLGKGMTS